MHARNTYTFLYALVYISVQSNWDQIVLGA